MTQRRVLKCGKKMQKGTRVRGDSLQQERTRIFWIFVKVQRVRRDSQRSGRTTQNPSTVTTQCGRTTSTHLLPTSRILRVYSQRAAEIWSQTPPLFEPQFILETIMWRFYILPKISLNEHWKSLFNASGKLIKDQNEIQGLYVINWQQQTWQRTTLLTEKGSSVIKCKNPWVRLSIVYGSKSRQSLEGEDRLASEFTPI